MVLAPWEQDLLSASVVKLPGSNYCLIRYSDAVKHNNNNILLETEFSVCIVLIITVKQLNNYFRA